MLEVYIEFLHHYTCGHCGEYWSVGDDIRVVGGKIACIGCSMVHTIPGKVKIGGEKGGISWEKFKAMTLSGDEEDTINYPY